MDLSPLSRLSAELRNEIYEMVLIHNNPIIITADNYTSAIYTPGFSPERHPLALLRACKQTSREATSLFYGNNSFCFEFAPNLENSEKDELCLLQRFCASIGNDALVGLRDIHMKVGRSFLDRAPPIYSEESILVHSRNLLGLQGISVLNDRLKIKYMIGECSYVNRSQWGLGEGAWEAYYFTEPIEIENLEITLQAVILSLQHRKRALPWNGYVNLSVEIALREELERFQKIAFGSGKVTSTFAKKYRRSFVIEMEVWQWTPTACVGARGKEEMSTI